MNRLFDEPLAECQVENTNLAETKIVPEVVGIINRITVARVGEKFIGQSGKVPGFCRRRWLLVQPMDVVLEPFAFRCLIDNRSVHKK